MNPRVGSPKRHFKDSERASHIGVVLPSKIVFLLRDVIYAPRGINYPVIDIRSLSYTIVTILFQ
jgi:hypothetical protein